MTLDDLGMSLVLAYLRSSKRRILKKTVKSEVPGVLGHVGTYPPHWTVITRRTIVLDINCINCSSTCRIKWPISSLASTLQTLQVHHGSAFKFWINTRIVWGSSTFQNFSSETGCAHCTEIRLSQWDSQGHCLKLLGETAVGNRSFV